MGPIALAADALAERRCVGADLEAHLSMSETITWQTNLESAISEATASGKLVLLDFSAAPM